MSELKAKEALALQFLMSEDLYLVDPIHAIVAENKADNDLQEVSLNVSATVSFDYLGENNKYFLILVNYPAHQFMAPKELEALQSILGAKKMELKDVAIVNLDKYQGATFQQLKSYLVSSRVVLFGINPQVLQLPSMPSNEVTEYETVKILPSFSFSEMMNDVEKKKVFWNVMKAL